MRLHHLVIVAATAAAAAAAEPPTLPPRPVDQPNEVSARYLVDVLPKRYHLTIEQSAVRARATGEWDEHLGFSPLFLLDEWRFSHGSLFSGIGFDAEQSSEEDLTYRRFGFTGIFGGELNLGRWCRAAFIARLGGGSATVRLPADLAAVLGDDREDISDIRYSLIGAFTFGNSDRLRWGLYGGYGGTYGTSSYTDDDQPYLEVSTYGPLAGLLWVHRF